MLKVTNAQNITFNVRVVMRGEKYGLNNFLTHDKFDPLVEFYDTRHHHTEHGQFVSRYYLSTLKNHNDRNAGLYLDGGDPNWSLTAKNMDDVRAFIWS